MPGMPVYVYPVARQPAVDVGPERPWPGGAGRLVWEDFQEWRGGVYLPPLSIFLCGTERRGWRGRGREVQSSNPLPPRGVGPRTPRPTPLIPKQAWGQGTYVTLPYNGRPAGAPSLPRAQNSTWRGDRISSQYFFLRILNQNEEETGICSVD